MSKSSTRSERAATAAAVIVATVLAIGASASAAPCWQPPLMAPVVDPYRQPACRWCPGNRGIEYATRPGTPVRAVAAGSVTFAGSVAGTNYVVVEHANGWRVTYGRLHEVAVRRGAVVVARSTIGTTTSEFHFGLRVDGQYRDPEPFLGRVVYRPRLIPVDGTPGAPPGPARLRCGSA